MNNRWKVACAVLMVSGLLGGGLASAAGAGVAAPLGPLALDNEPRAIELKAPTPDWYTPDLHERVLAARTRGESVPLPAAAREEIDVGLLFAGIRPGSWMISPAWCTLNFVFSGGGGGASGNGGGNGGDNGGGNGGGNDGGNGGGNGGGKDKDKDEEEEEEERGDVVGAPVGSRSTGSGVYIGTAGHCTETGEDVTIIAAPGVLMNIGVTVESVDNDLGDDFALIEIYPEMTEWVNPSMAVVAGPTGAESPAFGEPVLHVGHGIGIGTGGTPRAGVVTWLGEGDESNAYGWTGAASFGDSGSGVRAAPGEAVGNLTHLIVGVPYAPANVGGTSIDRILQIAGSVSTASLVPNPLP